jgi:hypothetical protein
MHIYPFEKFQLDIILAQTTIVSLHPLIGHIVPSGQAKKNNLFKLFYIVIFTRLRGFEPLTVRLEGVCSIQL